MPKDRKKIIEDYRKKVKEASKDKSTEDAAERPKAGRSPSTEVKK